MFCVNKNRNRLLLHILLYIAYTIIYLYIIVNIIVYIYMENDKFFQKKKTNKISYREFENCFAIYIQDNIPEKKTIFQY